MVELVGLFVNTLYYMKGGLGNNLYTLPVINELPFCDERFEGATPMWETAPFVDSFPPLDIIGLLLFKVLTDP